MIHLSPTAIREITRLKSRHSPSNSFLRLGIQPGGCSELHYTLELDDMTSGQDYIFDCNEIKVVVATQNLRYLDGLNLDYSEDLMGGGFRFHNPNARESCGCGNSFTIAESSDIQ